MLQNYEINDETRLKIELNSARLMIELMGRLGPKKVATSEGMGV